MPRRYTNRKRRYGKSNRKNAPRYGNWRRATMYVPAARTISRGVKTPFSKTVGDSIHVDGPLSNRRCMPPTAFMTHRYAEVVDISNENITGLTTTPVTFRLNSLFDPFKSGVGHQPQGFDQMAIFYRGYKVYKVHVQIKILSREAGSSTSTFIVANIKPSAGTYTPGSLQNMNTLQEVAENTIIDADDGKTFDQTWHIADIEGVAHNQIYVDNQFAANVATNPLAEPLLQLSCGDYNEITGQTVKVLVSFQFFTMWTSPQPLPTS